MTKPILQQTTELVAKDLEIEGQWEFLSEKELLDALSDHVEYMMKYRIELLMSTLYRLDVSEQKVAKAMQPLTIDPPNIGIAKLIIERQKQRIETKQNYKPSVLKDWMNFDLE